MSDAAQAAEATTLPEAELPPPPGGLGRYLRQAWLVLVLGIVFGAGLAGLQQALAPRIAANRLAETRSQAPALVPGAERIEALSVGERTVYRALADDRLVGWLVPASGPGFADRIQVLIGLDRQVERVTGLYVLDQKETPGLGDFITRHEWRAQFIDLAVAVPVTVVKEGARPANNQVDAVTGATISSVAVADIVNRAIDQLRPELQARVPAEAAP